MHLVVRRLRRDGGVHPEHSMRTFRRRVKVEEWSVGDFGVHHTLTVSDPKATFMLRSRDSSGIFIYFIENYIKQLRTSILTHSRTRKSYIGILKSRNSSSIFDYNFQFILFYFLSYFISLLSLNNNKYLLSNIANQISLKELISSDDSLKIFLKIIF